MDYHIITPQDSEYPDLLKRIYDPPQRLYIAGSIKPKDNLSLAVVGTRKFSNYGKEAAQFLVEQLVRSGLTIISGLARGIDTFAHRAALESGGRTIAVLGSGIKLITPPENRKMAEDITRSGAVISEFPPDFTPTQWSFPVRNRIIAGISLGTLVIEAPEKSGALITARHALDQGKDVFAVPGSIFSSTNIGANSLIKLGAYPVRTATDILEVLDIETQAEAYKARRALPDSKEEEVLLKLLEEGPLHIDELIRGSGFSTATVGSVISMLEIKGLVKNMGRQEYREM